ncbi:hypothetical protein CC80DRAFT_495451 [Byssothecium circinans]|uniref:Uncharacterized protein n=1 Tax=Byssothecium circinans TaxID=147558 RepID=A0A6A5TJ66_9PLEO|nr:hypothetical protein CC80DRAFT_495451 [Byssothecium circinans]
MGRIGSGVVRLTGFIKSKLRSSCEATVATESPNESSLPRKATTEEIQTLIHEVDDIPLTAWLLTFTGAVSQLARYGITVAWQNYFQNPRDGVIPGALGLGQA